MEPSFHASASSQPDGARRAAPRLDDPLAVVLASAGLVREELSDLARTIPALRERIEPLLESLLGIELAAAEVGDRLSRAQVRAPATSGQGPDGTASDGTASEGRGPAPAGRADGTGRSAGRAAPRVLVIDDDPMVSDTIRQVLRREHEVHVENDPRRALELVRGAPEFDVVLCDLTMRLVDGFEIFEAALAAAPGLARRFLFVTGGSASARAEEFLRSVPERTLAKPFRPADLRARVRAALAIPLE